LSQAVPGTGDNPDLVVGHGLGGLVALRLAVDDPSLVAGLVLLNPTPLLAVLRLSRDPAWTGGWGGAPAGIQPATHPYHSCCRAPLIRRLQVRGP